MRIRPDFSIACFVVLAMTFCASLAGCDPETRHRYLTYFVDGVPPLGAEQDGQNDANAVARDGWPESEKEQKQIWFVHEPWKECTTRKDCRTKCHKPPGVQFDPSSARLLKPVPDLCFDCHEEFAVSEIYVHGPKIAGECVFCHEGHKSKVKGLLKKELPELCHQCHELIESEPIPEHAEGPKRRCTECHDPHGGSDRYFLKK